MAYSWVSQWSPQWVQLVDVDGMVFMVLGIIDN